jgi:hypothetical protein
MICADGDHGAGTARDLGPAVHCECHSEASVTCQALGILRDEGVAFTIASRGTFVGSRL